MDNLTHSLVGALIGQAGLKRTTGRAIPALALQTDVTCFSLIHVSPIRAARADSLSHCRRGSAPGYARNPGVRARVRAA